MTDDEMIASMEKKLQDLRNAAGAAAGSYAAIPIRTEIEFQAQLLARFKELIAATKSTINNNKSFSIDENKVVSGVKAFIKEMLN